MEKPGKLEARETDRQRNWKPGKPKARETGSQGNRKPEKPEAKETGSKDRLQWIRKLKRTMQPVAV